MVIAIAPHPTSSPTTSMESIHERLNLCVNVSRLIRI